MMGSAVEFTEWSGPLCWDCFSQRKGEEFEEGRARHFAGSEAGGFLTYPEGLSGLNLSLMCFRLKLSCFFMFLQLFMYCSSEFRFYCLGRFFEWGAFIVGSAFIFPLTLRIKMQLSDVTDVKVVFVLLSRHGSERPNQKCANVQS